MKCSVCQRLLVELDRPQNSSSCILSKVVILLKEVTRKNNVVQRGKLNNDINFILILESKMKSKFSKVSQWLVANKLSLNIDKTN